MEVQIIMAGKGTRKGGKRKWGRAKEKCKQYQMEGRRERNKERKAKKRQRKRLQWLKNREQRGVITDKQRIELRRAA
jgi:hypothetical protein